VQRREIGQGILNDQVLLDKAKSLQSKLQVSFPLLPKRFCQQFFIYIINMSQKGEKIQFFKYNSFKDSPLNKKKLFLLLNNV
jgi:hypothetical protein